MKFLLLALVVGGLLWWLTRRGRAPLSGRGADQAGRDAEAMVVCAHCGVHLPRSDALVDGAHAYCSQAHQLAGPNSSGRS